VTPGGSGLADQSAPRSASIATVIAVPVAPMAMASRTDNFSPSLENTLAKTAAITMAKGSIQSSIPRSPWGAPTFLTTPKDIYAKQVEESSREEK